MDDPCKICHKTTAKYTCPRCHVRYCSIACYRFKDHESCSEQFYKECFIDGLKDFNTTGDDKQNVLEMLQRLETEDQEDRLDDDDDEEEELEERLKGLDLDRDTDTVWSRLNAREKREFQKMLSDGRLGNMVKLWEPWWKIKDPSKVEEVGATSTLIKHPSLHHAPDLATLTKNDPSPCIVYDIINILYGYAYVTRLHNGSHCDTPLQVLKELELISGALKGSTYQDLPSSLHSCIHQLSQQAKKCQVSQDFTVAVITDVKDIIIGPHQRAPLTYIMAALSDVYALSRAARKTIETDLKKVADKPETSEKRRQLGVEKKKWFQVRKKVEYLLSWTHKYGLQLQELIPLIDLEFCAVSTDMVRHKEDKMKYEEAWGGVRPPRMRKLVQELDR